MSLNSHCKPFLLHKSHRCKYKKKLGSITLLQISLSLTFRSIYTTTHFLTISVFFQQTDVLGSQRVWRADGFTGIHEQDSSQMWLGSLTKCVRWLNKNVMTAHSENINISASLYLCDQLTLLASELWCGWVGSLGTHDNFSGSRSKKVWAYSQKSSLLCEPTNL